MSDGRILKPDKDFTKEADKQIPEAQELAKVASMHLYCPNSTDQMKFRVIYSLPSRNFLSLRSKPDRYIPAPEFLLCLTNGP